MAVNERTIFYLSHAPEAMYAMLRAHLAPGLRLVTLAEDDDAERFAALPDADAVLVGTAGGEVFRFDTRDFPAGGVVLFAYQVEGRVFLAALVDAPGAARVRCAWRWPAGRARPAPGTTRTRLRSRRADRRGTTSAP